MRSTKIVIFLVLLNASAVFVGSTAMAQELGVQPTVGGDEQIDTAEQRAQEVATDRGQVDNFIGGIIEAASVLVTVFSVAIAGPQMLINLGAPPALVGVLAAPLYIVVGIDILQTISGRQLE